MNMIVNQPKYEIYCLYHNKVFPKYYGDQIDKLTFVKVDNGHYIFKSKKHIHLSKEVWFRSIGKGWAEYEFYYSLYKGYLEGKVELPEYIGFIQYDMEFFGVEDKYKNISIIDFIEELFRENRISKSTIVVFQPYDFNEIYNQNIKLHHCGSYAHNCNNPENCIDTIIRETNEFLNANIDIESLKSKRLSLCGSFFVHKSVFIELMIYVEKIVEDGRLSMFNKDRFVRNTNSGAYIERYIAIFLEYLNLQKIEFGIKHYNITGSIVYRRKSRLNRLNRLLGNFGTSLKLIFPRIYKILKPYFPDGLFDNNRIR